MTYRELQKKAIRVNALLHEAQKTGITLEDRDRLLTQAQDVIGEARQEIMTMRMRKWQKSA